MSQFIDRRHSSRHKGAVNRQRFFQRFKNQIKKSVSDAIANRSITDIENGEKINIPNRDISEPHFHFGKGGRRNIVLSGNHDYIPGDTIKRPPPANEGNNSQASNNGEGQDDFVFQISREEFLEIFFDDLELPNLVKRQITKIPNYKLVRSGFVSEGVPTNINLVRSLRSALSRRIAVGTTYKKRLKQAENELELLLAKTKINVNHTPPNPRIITLQEEIKLLKAKIQRIPFIDPFDIKYNNRVRQQQPSTQAVMFCLMDVSGSMDEAKKDIAKRFFILLYLFLSRSYETTELVFIRHHTSAKEVNEQEFFYSRETGGTVVSSALELMYEIMQKRYPASEWNIYGAQASDGDNWNNDSPRCRELLINNIMPMVQYFSYVEIMPRQHQSLWESYESIAAAYNNFSMQHITHYKDIYPVFRELFKRQHDVPKS